MHGTRTNTLIPEESESVLANSAAYTALKNAERVMLRVRLRDESLEMSLPTC